jgi:succinate dehydrogenase/fumarate reductase flavoprotein subunit
MNKDNSQCIGVIAMNLEDGSIHRFHANNTILATGYVVYSVLMKNI